MKAKLIIIPLLFLSCQLIPDLRQTEPSKQIEKVTPMSVNTLYDSWAANRNFNINTNNTTWTTWTGSQQAGIIREGGGSVHFPANAILTFNGSSDYLSAPATMPITGSVTFFFSVNEPVAKAGEVDLFDGVNTPRAILKLRISTTNGHIGLSYNNVNFDTGINFPNDDQYHILSYVLDQTTAKIYLDGSQIGSTFTITGGGIDFTISKSRIIFRNFANSNHFKGNAKRVAIYSNAVDDAGVSSISTDLLTDLTSRPVIKISTLGQSNLLGAMNLVSELPDSLKGIMPNVYMWDVAGRFTKSLNPGIYPVGVGPITSMAYDLSHRFPDHDIYICQYGVTGTNLAVDWNSRTPGVRWTTFKGYHGNFTTWLGVEGRQVDSTFVGWAQGENDCINLTYANAYQVNEANILADLLAAPFNAQKIVSMQINIHDNPSLYIYRTTVRAAKVANIASNIKLSDTDSYAIHTDGVHLTTTSQIFLGKDWAKNL